MDNILVIAAAPCKTGCISIFVKDLQEGSGSFLVVISLTLQNLCVMARSAYLTLPFRSLTQSLTMETGGNFSRDEVMKTMGSKRVISGRNINETYKWRVIRKCVLFFS
jgi:hypothetical protein